MCRGLELSAEGEYIMMAVDEICEKMTNEQIREEMMAHIHRKQVQKGDYYDKLCGNGICAVSSGSNEYVKR